MVEFHHGLSERSVWYRYFSLHPLEQRIAHRRLARMCCVDYDREMALVAIELGSDGAERSLGEVRTVVDSGNVIADFAVVVRSELKGRGLGRLLLQSMIDYSRSRGTRELRGETLAGNSRMLNLAQDLGFTLKTGADMGTVDLRLTLREPEEPAP